MGFSDDDDNDDTDDTDLFLSSLSEISIHYNYIIIIIYYNATVNYPQRRKINTPTVIGVIVIGVIVSRNYSKPV